MLGFLKLQFIFKYVNGLLTIPGLLGFLVLLFLSGFFLDQILIEKLTYDVLWKVTFLSRLTTEVGDATVYFVLSIGLWLGTYLIIKFRAEESLKFLKRERIDAVQRWAKSFLFSLLAAAVVIHSIKMLVGRMRPYATAGAHGEFDPWIFDPLTIHPDFHSFPSGHSQVVFCAFVAFSSLFRPNQKWLHGLLFLFCMWVAFTRVPTHNHFLTDVLVGSLIGFVVAKYFFRHHDRGPSSKFH